MIKNKTPKLKKMLKFLTFFYRLFKGMETKAF